MPLRTCPAKLRLDFRITHIVPIGDKESGADAVASRLVVKLNQPLREQEIQKRSKLKGEKSQQQFIYALCVEGCQTNRIKLLRQV